MQKVNGDTVAVWLLAMVVSHTPNPNITEIQKTVKGSFPTKDNLKEYNVK